MSLGVKSSLERHVPAAPSTPQEIGAMRRRAFVEHGVAMIRLSDVVDPWTKQAVINEARRQLDVPQVAETMSRRGRR
jgi:hypothetical protein